jgi:outer membrane protein
MIRTRIIFLGAALALGGPLTAQDTGLIDPDATKITLDDALDRALRRSPQVAQSEQTVLNAYEARRTTVGSFLPSLSTSSSMSVRPASRFDETLQEIVSGSANSYSAGLNSGVTLFRGGQRFSDFRRNTKDIEAAEARREDQRFAVGLQTKQFFFTALEQEELLEVAESRLDQALQSLELTRSRFVGQEATASDTLRARLEFVNSRQAVLTAESNLRAGRFALGRQIGLSEPVIPVSPGNLDPSPLPMSEEEMIQLAENGSPSVIAAEASRLSAEASLSSAKAAWLPSFSANGSYNWSNQQFGFDGGRTSWGIGFSMSYPLFNGFNRESSIARAGNAYQVARLQDDDARLAARQQVDGALRALETAERAIAIAQEAVVVAEEDLRITRIRYRENVAIILDVVTSQIALDQARVDLVRSRFNYVIARAQLEAVLGRLL